MKDDMTMKEVRARLAEIVGAQNVSGHAEERYIYSRDMGTINPEPAGPGGDAGIRPRRSSRVVALAHEKKYYSPMGGGLTLSGICRPLRGGIVLDMKRMNRILKVNEVSSYALVEAGVSQGMLHNLSQEAPSPAQALRLRRAPHRHHRRQRAHPRFGPSFRSGGFHSEMLNGLEAVLPTGEVVRVGSCAASPHWFSRAPLPDLAGLFVGWTGTTGVVTRLAIKLYPSRSLNDVRVFITEDPELVPDVIRCLGQTQVAEDITAAMSQRPEWLRGLQMIPINFGAESKGTRPQARPFDRVGPRLHRSEDRRFHAASRASK